MIGPLYDVDQQEPEESPEKLRARNRELERMKDWLVERNLELAHENARLKADKGGPEKESRPTAMEKAFWDAMSPNLAMGWPGSWLGF